MAERTIVLDGFSKTFAMTGWRLGYAIVPDVARPDLRPAHHQHDQRAPRRSPRSARSRRCVGPQDDVDAMVVEFKARRDLIVDGLNAIPGIDCRTPVGAFYAFPSDRRDGPVRAPSWPSGCSRRPASASWPGRRSAASATDHIRISYANSQENLTEALGRIRALRRAALGRG